MRKRIFAVLLVVISILTLSVSASDTRIRSVNPELTFSGTTANCSVSVTDSRKEIDVTMELWCGSTLVDSWSNDGVTYVTVEGSCRVTKGKTYTLKTYGTADDVRFTGPSVSKTC